jgi:hypothetical protein
VKTSWTIKIHLILKNGGKEGKINIFWGWVPVGGGGEGDTRKGGMRVYMVDVFCIHI